MNIPKLYTSLEDIAAVRVVNKSLGNKDRFDHLRDAYAAEMRENAIQNIIDLANEHKLESAFCEHVFQKRYKLGGIRCLPLREPVGVRLGGVVGYIVVEMGRIRYFESYSDEFGFENEAYPSYADKLWICRFI